MNPLHPLLNNDDDAVKQYELLVKNIRKLIISDLNQLVQILYRIDVSEIALKEALNDDPDKDAAELIADLILKRQAKKEAFKSKNINRNDIPEEDRW